MTGCDAYHQREFRQQLPYLVGGRLRGVWCACGAWWVGAFVVVCMFGGVRVRVRVHPQAQWIQPSPVALWWSWMRSSA